MKAVQELVAYFDRGGRLSRRQLTTLLDKNRIAAEAPDSMHGLCEVVGAVHYFRVTGRTEGQIWGTDTYTQDSNLAAAAVHAGLVKPGDTKVLRVTVVPALESYAGTTRNGVTTSDYGQYPQAWRLSAL